MEILEETVVWLKSYKWLSFTQVRIWTSISRFGILPIELLVYLFFLESIAYFNVKKKNRAIQLYNLTEQDNFLFFFEADNRLFNTSKDSNLDLQREFYQLNYSCIFFRVINLIPSSYLQTDTWEED